MKTAHIFILLTLFNFTCFAEIPLFQSQFAYSPRERTFSPDKFINKYQPDFIGSAKTSLDRLSVHELAFLIRRYSVRLQGMLREHRSSLSTVHHWEFCARIDIDWNGRTCWQDLGSSKGTGNQSMMRIANQTRVCFHVHPTDSVPWPSWNDRRAARDAYTSLTLSCTQQDLQEPQPVWMVTIHSSGQLWAWKDGMKEALLIGQLILEDSPLPVSQLVLFQEID